jgi:hypothetical protein
MFDHEKAQMMILKQLNDKLMKFEYNLIEDHDHFEVVVTVTMPGSSCNFEFEYRGETLDREYLKSLMCQYCYCKYGEDGVGVIECMDLGASIASSNDLFEDTIAYTYSGFIEELNKYKNELRSKINSALDKNLRLSKIVCDEATFNETIRSFVCRGVMNS